MSAFARLLSGRKKESRLHNYFNYVPDKDKSKYIVKNSNGKECGVEISGKTRKIEKLTFASYI